MQIAIGYALNNWHKFTAFLDHPSPHGLSEEKRHRVTDYAIARIGHLYDLRNIFDLARYLLPTPPVPSRY